MQPRTPITRSDLSSHTPASTTPTIPSRNAGEGPGSVVINACTLPIDFNAFGADGDAKPVTLEVIPPPGADGVLPARDRRRQRVADAGALAAALNAQPVLARVDFDHASEPTSPTYAHSSVAQGWLVRYRLNHRGGIDADMELGADALDSIRAKKYRYISPALHLDRNDTVVGMSSLALVNNPNFRLTAPSIHSESDMPDDTDPKALQAKIDALEKQLDESRRATNAVLNNAAAQAVDQAVTAGRILPAQKDYHLGAIQSHADGIEAGIAAFNAFAGAGTDAPGSAPTGALTQRIGPTGRPPSESDAPAGAGEFPVPNGWTPPSKERLDLHARIATHARQRGISYREAVIELGAAGG